jgi:hypothetical protein
MTSQPSLVLRDAGIKHVCSRLDQKSDEPTLGKKGDESSRAPHISRRQSLAASVATAATNVLREPSDDCGINVDQSYAVQPQPRGKVAGWIDIVGDGQPSVVEFLQLGCICRDQMCEIACVHEAKRSRRTLLTADHIVSPQDPMGARETKLCEAISLTEAR